MQEMQLANSDPGQGMSERRETGTETVPQPLWHACAWSSAGELLLRSYLSSGFKERNDQRVSTPNMRFPSIGVVISDGKRISEKDKPIFFWGAALSERFSAATPSLSFC